jgi:hypothetical protein
MPERRFRMETASRGTLVKAEDAGLNNALYVAISA